MTPAVPVRAGSAPAENVLGRVRDLAQRAGHDGLALRLERELAASRSASAVVVVAGEPGQGKSELINALLDRPGLLPVGRPPCTGVYVAVTHGSGDAATVVLSDGDRREIALAEVADWASVRGNPGNQKQVASVQITLDHELLAQGIALVDTPGVGGLDSAHGRATRAVLAWADALLFVTGAGAPLSQAELGFLAEARTRIDTVVFALTKTDDQLPADVEVIARAAEGALERAGWPSVTAPGSAGGARQPGRLISVSAAGHLRAGGRRGPAAGAESEDGIESLRSELVRLAESGVQAMRRANLLRVVLGAIAELELADAALVEANPDLADQIAAEEKRMRELDAATARWPSDLSFAFQLLAPRLTERIANLVRELGGRYDDRALGEYVGSPEEFAELMQAEARAVSTQVEAFLGEEIADIEAELAESIMGEAGGLGDEELPSPRSLAELEILLSVRAGPGGSWTRSARLLLGAVGPGTTSAVLLRYAGAAVAIPFVLPLGLALGALMSRADYVKAREAVRLEPLRAIRQDALSQITQKLSTRGSEDLARARKLLEASVRQCLRQRRDALAQSRATLEQRARSSEPQRRAARERLAELARLRQRIETELSSAAARPSLGMEVV